MLVRNISVLGTVVLGLAAAAQAQQLAGQNFDTYPAGTDATLVRSLQSDPTPTLTTSSLDAGESAVVSLLYGQSDPNSLRMEMVAGGEVNVFVPFTQNVTGGSLIYSFSWLKAEAFDPELWVMLTTDNNAYFINTVGVRNNGINNVAVQGGFQFTGDRLEQWTTATAEVTINSLAGGGNSSISSVITITGDGLTPLVYSGTQNIGNATALTGLRFQQRRPGVIFIDDIAAIVPEPASISLIGLGAMGLLARRRA